MAGKGKYIYANLPVYVNVILASMLTAKPALSSPYTTPVS
jgi:hypothetical protein